MSPCPDAALQEARLEWCVAELWRQTPKTMRISVIAALIGLFVCACSSQQLYAAGRNAQRAECMRQADSTIRDRCLKDVAMSHDAYHREADAARK